MLIGDFLGGGGMDSLELTLRFAGARQRVIASNIANIDTPDYIPLDLSPGEFQKTLASAIDRRRSAGNVGPLQLGSTAQMRVDGPAETARVTFTPTTPSGNILFHDRNNRDIERLMQANVENLGVYRLAAELLRTRLEVTRVAISERV